MLEELIVDWFFMEVFLSGNSDIIDGYWYGFMTARQKGIQKTIEKVDGRTWEEIKEIVDEYHQKK